MNLNQNKPSNVNLIKSISIDLIEINEDSFKQSCIVSNNNLIKLELKYLDELTIKHITQLIASNPEIVLLGSGNEHSFPNVELLQQITERNIGFEVMNNKSASRTYNVLVAEGRKVSCLLIIN